MNYFKVGSFQLANGKWAPAGILFIVDDTDAGRISLREVEFDPQFRFDSEEEANEYFRQYYLEKGFKDKDVSITVSI